jgi:hypothetical protein
LFNLNFNHSFNQTPIFVKPTSTKSTFYKITFFKPQPQQQPQYQTRSKWFLPLFSFYYLFFFKLRYFLLLLFPRLTLPDLHVHVFNNTWVWKTPTQDFSTSLHLFYVRRHQCLEGMLVRKYQEFPNFYNFAIHFGLIS